MLNPDSYKILIMGNYKKPILLARFIKYRFIQRILLKTLNLVVLVFTRKQTFTKLVLSYVCQYEYMKIELFFANLAST